MDRINKFLDARPQKHVKTIKYKNEKFEITKDDLKRVRAYKSGKCLDPAIKSIPNRIVSNGTLEAKPEKTKKDMSDYFNNRLKERYRKNPQTVMIEAVKNEIVDVWEDENTETLKKYSQEWVYSINKPYEGRVEGLEFTKDSLEQEIKRVFKRQFTPRDPKRKSMGEILPKMPEISSLRPFPERLAFEWEQEGKKFLFNRIIGGVDKRRVKLVDTKYNKTIFEEEFEEEVDRIAYDKECLIIAVKNVVYQIEFMKTLGKISERRKIAKAETKIREVYISGSFIGYISSRTIHIHDRETGEEIKILKLKGDTPRTMRIEEDKIYASTHKGIMIESEERSEIKNLGYVIDFEMRDGRIYAVNNLGRLMIVDERLKIVGSTIQGEIGLQVRVHKVYGLIAVVLSSEICIYKIVGNESVPVWRIAGAFKAVSWDEEMPWLYAAGNKTVGLYT